MSSNIEQVREHLLSTLADLRNREQPMEIDRARAIAQVAAVIVDTARVEVDYIKATGQDTSPFMAGQTPQIESGVERKQTKTGIVEISGNVTKHKLLG